MRSGFARLRGGERARPVTFRRLRATHRENRTCVRVGGENHGSARRRTGAA